MTEHSENKDPRPSQGALPSTGKTVEIDEAESPAINAPESPGGRPTIDLDRVGHDEGRYKAPNHIKTQDYDPRPNEDAARRRIAYVLIFLLLIICVSTFGTLWWTDVEVETLLRVVEMLLGPVIALVSAATGFYYGTKSSGK